MRKRADTSGYFPGEHPGRDLRTPFRVLYADPPWRFGDKLPGPSRGAEKNYACMTVDEVCAFPLPPIADDALLFLWRVASQPEEALRVVRAWGFVPKSEVVWVKMSKHGEVHNCGPGVYGEGLAFGMGRYVRGCHETCIVATRGKAAALVRDHAVRSVFFAPRGEHSAKPDEMYRIIERLVAGPWCELFARRRREGWTQYGLELGGAAASP